MLSCCSFVGQQKLHSSMWMKQVGSLVAAAVVVNWRGGRVDVERRNHLDQVLTNHSRQSCTLLFFEVPFRSTLYISYKPFPTLINDIDLSNGDTIDQTYVSHMCTKALCRSATTTMGVSKPSPYSTSPRATVSTPPNTPTLPEDTQVQPDGLKKMHRALNRPGIAFVVPTPSKPRDYPCPRLPVYSVAVFTPLGLTAIKKRLNLSKSVPNADSLSINPPLQ